jgi:hypothetical protein
LKLNPFGEFKPDYLPRLIKLGRRYLVSQTYCRAREQGAESISSRINLLFSDYSELGEAKLHLNAVKNDRYAAIIDLNRTAHLKKIEDMLTAGSGYLIFFAVVRSAKELENKINNEYKEKLKQYIDNHTNWRLSRDTLVKPTLQLSFGELYIILKHGSQQIRIKFEEIEMY